MNGKLKISFLLSIVFLLVFSIFTYGQEQPVAPGTPQRVPLPQVPEGPECAKTDKGDCQAVCNYHKNPDGSVNEAGCMAEFKKIPQKALCPNENQPRVYYVGCDLTGPKECSTSQGKGYWCNCYSLCYGTL